MKKSLSIRVKGRVQNVGFRYHTNKNANELGIKGFVQNKPDGSVYLEAEGEESDLQKLVDWLHRGPGWAEVKEVDITEQPLQQYNCFKVR
ncbi:MAG: acylphosphatase [Bacteroidales bacterium]|nr:acylphosphatase [Bacteroidales bacterium]MCF8345329.1 acylphosphatase [Bacteroidales bacterium]MCF8349610.1 acylphosphatase [Bacteroidales bacterium]MCF8376051.1 acylphosphatase [Bacteroidales bacterium]MCF8400416.1 acylphosphatase [Bacteroidales bacterium]